MMDVFDEDPGVLRVVHVGGLTTLWRPLKTGDVIENSKWNVETRSYVRVVVSKVRTGRSRGLF